VGQQKRETAAQARMTPVRSPQAIEDLVELRNYIAQDDPPTAAHVARHIVRRFNGLLRQHPGIGWPTRF
jgi:plasmid stabilization system protein ParE